MHCDSELEQIQGLSQCICAAGSIDTSTDPTTQICEPCSKGLSCPEGSTLDSLKSGMLKGRGVDANPATWVV